MSRPAETAKPEYAATIRRKLLYMRLFVGIPLAPDVVNRLSVAVARLSAPEDGLRWTLPASWHITLQFLGEASPAQCQELIGSLSEIKSAPFSVHVEDVGCFDRAGVVYADIHPSAELFALERKVVAATARVGFQAEQKPYRPHITLARAKGRQGLPAARCLGKSMHGLDFGSFKVQEFLLLESFLEPAGARYEARHAFRLG